MLARYIYLPIVAATLLATGCATIPGLGDSPGVSHLRADAEAGNVESAYSLGVRYTNGQGVRKSDTAAAKWFRYAAERGHPKAQYMLGVAFAAGHGVRRDPEEAVVWWERSAEAGFDRAQYQLGEAYLNGRGVTADPVWAARWYGKAADQGHLEAQFALGVAFAKGLGLPKHPGEAAKWLTLAKKGGHPLAGEVLAQMPKAQQRDGARRAARWRPRTYPVFADRPTVRLVQFELAERGYSVGPIDGLTGSQTQTAIAEYRRSVGLSSGSAITPALLERLRS